MTRVAREALHAAWAALVRFAMPAACLNCGAPVDRELLCAACLATLVPTLHTAGIEGPEGRTAVVYAFPFAETARSLVHALKFHSTPRAAELLASRATPIARLVGAGALDLAVPVPLAAARRRERGYNQSLLLARALGRRLALPVSAHALRRVRATGPQTGLDAAARRRNVRGAFRADPAIVGGRCVLLVDDVVTTGATLAEARTALSAAGARSILALAVAGTPMTDREGLARDGSGAR